MLLGDDLRLFRSQLESALLGHPLANVLVGRLDDLGAMLVALDGDLRRICAMLESPFTRDVPFPLALSQLADAFSERTGIVPDVRLEGQLESLDDMQQVTLLSLMREALNNVREHSDADAVEISVRAGDGLVAEPSPTMGTASIRRSHWCRQRARATSAWWGCTSACACSGAARRSTAGQADLP